MSTPEPPPQPPQQPPGAPPPYPPPYAYPYPPPSPPTNGMSIAALVVGIVGACNPIGVLALIFGYIAKRQIEERGEQGRGFAVAGIVLGWIGLASIVFWILYMVFVLSVWVPFVSEMSDPDTWPTPEPTEIVRLVSR
ncbi:DUF4190 domain-containing protein [Glycomyces xiaoerkulensis]|uniref:DUF4190 domain-containing protein n=1 Tax=Glycomyces xiaoerkulensis TaxID=2038139 RepID=UPI000C26BFF5|nr:DUF4190 domain-containing protein [Glycomyces xiaoerkulensis]